MLPSAACSRVQEASDGTGLLGEPGASSPAILSSDGEHGTASGCAHTGDLLAAVGGVSRGGASCPPAVPPAFARRSWRGAAHVCRRLAVAPRAAAHTVAPLLPRAARLVVHLAGVGASLWAAPGD